MQIIPHPGPQTKALRSSAFETLFGGSRGPGKTFAGLLWLVKPYLLSNPRARALVIRRNADDLSDWTDRARSLYTPLGAEFAGKPVEIRFPSGYKIRTGHLKDDNAYTKYQGHEYQRILIEELTQISQERHYIQLIASCRSTLPDVDPRVFATTNPGGVGHQWVKNRFVSPAPPNTTYTDPNGLTRVFIPGTLEDNPTLFEGDPNYKRQLDALRETDPELYKAWRLGDWDTFAGQFFREFDRRRHVVPVFQPNYQDRDLTFVGGLDWGRAAPFSFHASVVVRCQTPDGIKFNRLITFAEIYGTDKNPAEWGEIIRKRVNLAKFSFIMCDNQIFAPGNDNSVDIAQQFINFDDSFLGLLKPATKDRVGGWQNMHNWLSLAPDGLPYWLITDNCVNLIRELPEAIHDELKVEDIDSVCSDHALDDCRYCESAIQWIDAKIGAVRTGPQKIISSIKPTLIAAPTRFDPAIFEKVSAHPVSSWREV